MVGTALLSALISNTGTVATLLPAVVAAAWTVGSVPSKFLMPLAFAMNTGGLLTLTGTPPNIVVAQAFVEDGTDPFRRKICPMILVHLQSKCHTAHG